MGLLDALGMSWPTATLDGVSLFEGEGKAWLHAICQAVNERQSAIDIAKTEWILADGSEAADPVLTDFDGIRVHGEDSPVRINMERAQDAIKAMLNGPFHPIPGVGYFTEESGHSDRWTVASIEIDMGLGAFESGDFQFHNLNYWAQIKGALDRMIYARRGVSPSFVGATSDQKLGSISGTPEDAWDDMYSDGEETEIATSFEGVRWAVFTAGFGYRARATQNIIGLSYDNEFSGTLVEVGYSISTGMTNFTGSVDVEIGTATATISSAGTSEQLGEADLPLGSSGSIDVQITTPLPSADPFELSGSPFTGNFQVLGFSAIYYFDISSELTDQT